MSDFFSRRGMAACVEAPIESATPSYRPDSPGIKPTHHVTSKLSRTAPPTIEADAALWPWWSTDVPVEDLNYGQFDDQGHRLRGGKR